MRPMTWKQRMAQAARAAQSWKPSRAELERELVWLDNLIRHEEEILAKRREARDELATRLAESTFTK